MANYELERAEHDLEELRIILRGWHVNKDSNRLDIERIRASEFPKGERIMEGLVYGVKPERRLRLTIGQTAIRASWFRKGAYDMYSEQNELLDPGAALDLVTAKTWSGEWPDLLGRKRFRDTLYVGRPTQMVRLDRVAETLMDGGTLEIVDTQEQVAA